jgi:hypothetical protein
LGLLTGVQRGFPLLDPPFVNIWVPSLQLQSLTLLYLPHVCWFFPGAFGCAIVRCKHIRTVLTTQCLLSPITFLALKSSSLRIN